MRHLLIGVFLLNLSLLSYAEKGKVRLIAYPDKATFLLGGREYNSGDIVELEEGEYQVKVFCENYISIDTIVTAVRYKLNYLRVNLDFTENFAFNQKACFKYNSDKVTNRSFTGAISLCLGVIYGLNLPMWARNKTNTFYQRSQDLRDSYYLSIYQSEFDLYSDTYNETYEKYTIYMKKVERRKYVQFGLIVLESIVLARHLKKRKDFKENKVCISLDAEESDLGIKIAYGL